MDNKGEEELEQQINKLRQQLEEKQSDQKKFIYNIYGILYSGNNFDEYGNKQLNPAISSVSRYTKNGEEIMSVANNSGWWESLTYPGEFVFIEGNTITKRFDEWKSLYADFDYRFCHIKPIECDFQEIFEKEKQLLKNFDQEVFGIQLSDLKYGMEERDYDICKNRVENVFDYIDIFVRNDDSIKKFVETQEELDELLVEVEEVNELLELSKIQYDSLEERVDNIFKNAMQNVHISGCQNVYLDPNGEHKNITIQNSSNVQLFGNENVYIDGCENIILGKSTEEGRVDLINVSDFYTGNSFCDNNGQFMYYNTDLRKSTGFCFIGRDTFKTARIVWSGLFNCNTIIKSLSFNYSEGIMVNMLRSSILCENAAVRYTNINIKDSFLDGYLHLTKYSCVNGELSVGPGSFIKGILSFKASEFLFEQQIQNLVCPSGLEMFYMEKEFKDLVLLKGSQYIVEDSISIINENGKIIKDNGPFDLEEIVFNARENQYLETELPEVLHNETSSTWYGYMMTSKNTQSFNPWGRLELGEEFIEDMISVEFENEVKDYPITNKKWIDGVLDLSVEVVGKIKRLELQISQSVESVVINGESMEFVDCEFDYFVDDVVGGDLFINFPIETRSIKVRGGDSLETFNFEIGEKTQDKIDLENVDILFDLVRKIENPSAGMFRGCTKFNPIQFVLELPCYSADMFNGVDFRGTEVEEIVILPDIIPESCFFESKWNSSVNKFIFENATHFDVYCFAGVVSQAHEIVFAQFKESSGMFEFWGTQSIKTITFLEDRISVSVAMFKDCEIEKVVGKILEVEASGFEFCHNLSEIDLTECESIEAGAFEANSIHNLDLENIVEIDEYSFAACKKLTLVKINSQTFNKEFKQHCFYECETLEYVKFTGMNDDINVKVYQNAFRNCLALRNLGDINEEYNTWFSIKESNTFTTTLLSQLYVSDIDNGVVDFLSHNLGPRLDVIFSGVYYYGGFERIGNSCSATIYVIDEDVYEELFNIVTNDQNGSYTGTTITLEE